MSVLSLRDFTQVSLLEWLKTGCLISQNENELILGWGKGHFAESANKNALSIYAPDFYLQSPRPWVIFEKTTRITPIELSHLLQSLNLKKPNSRHWHEPSPKGFERVFAEIQSQIQSTDLTKAVPVTFATSASEFTIEEKAHSLIQSLQYSSRLYSYGFWNVHEGLLGLTPELLFELDDKRLQTMALAGTRSLDKADELMSDSKERAEHQFVVDDIAQQLQSLGELNIGSTEVASFKNIAHLKTAIEVNINEATGFQTLIQALHPTPALGVSPRRPLDQLHYLECDLPRERFGAPFGVLLPNGNAMVLVAIRNIQWDKEHVLLGSGCGIVSMSRMNSEWAELELKRQTVKTNLGLE